jgi:D-glycero-D-manno-heptose 1,7-bisphosphate phosphatase
MKPAVFLDRDGTINVEKNYLHRVEDWEWIPGAPEAIARLNEAGYLVVVVTNQAGIARGLYTELDVQVLHAHISAELEMRGARVDAYYYCPHHPLYGERQDCNCRKPKPGMLFEAVRKMGIDLESSWLVGDKLIDMQAANAADVSGILVQTGYGRQQSNVITAKYRTAADLPMAVSMIIRRTHNKCGRAQ